MLKLYHCPNARSMRSLWLLYELNIDFELVEMPFDQKYTRSPEYLSVHPLGRVPCLVHDQTTLYESGAICQYLRETFDKEDKLGRSLGHKEHDEWLLWLHYAETVAVHGESLVQQNIIIAEELRSPVVIKLESRRLEKAIEVLNDHLNGIDYLENPSPPFDLLDGAFENFSWLDAMNCAWEKGAFRRHSVTKA